MERNKGNTNLFLGTVIIGLLAAIIYLTQKNYALLINSNNEVIKTTTLISEHQKVSNDFKNAVIYISTYRNGPTQAYLETYGKGMWEITFDMRRLKRLVSNSEGERLDTLAKQINAEEDWLLLRADSNNTRTYSERAKHIKNIIAIQGFFDTQIAKLQRQSIEDVKASQLSLERVHFWIITLILSASVIVLLSFLLINSQVEKVKVQNGRLRDIAWIQSHKVRAQVATLLGLGQLFNHDNPKDKENIIVVNNIIVTTQKLDEIVKEINHKTEV